MKNGKKLKKFQLKHLKKEFSLYKNLEENEDLTESITNANKKIREMKQRYDILSSLGRPFFAEKWWQSRVNEMFEKPKQ